MSLILPKAGPVNLLNNAAISSIFRGFLVEIPWAMEITL